MGSLTTGSANAAKFCPASPRLFRWFTVALRRLKVLARSTISSRPNLARGHRVIGFRLLRDSRGDLTLPFVFGGYFYVLGSENGISS